MTGFKWLMRIQRIDSLKAKPLTDELMADILNPSFTVVEFRSVWNHQKNQREYQYKPFNQWETYFIVPAEFYETGNWLAREVTLEHWLPHKNTKGYYKIERVN